MDSTPEPDQEPRRREVPRSWLIAGLAALIFQVEMGWTMWVKLKSTVMGSEHNAEWFAGVAGVVTVLGIMLTGVSLLAYIRQRWAIIVNSCLGWMVFEGITCGLFLTLV